MKNLRQICLGLFLVLVLSIPAFAGDIHIPGFTAGPQVSSKVKGLHESPGIAGDVLTPGIVSLILAAMF